ncbi:MAG: LamG domain-containing protein [Verrucomicrobia bacterium]|nr:LamG domain-containing protein [Verrucomicrobiota bacterium]
MTQTSTLARYPHYLTATVIAALTIVLIPASQAALKDGLVSYWPLDNVVGTKTPDLVSGYDLELANLTSADLVAGKVGSAFKFDNARQTMLRRISSPGEQLPINQHPAFTISFWANVTGTGQSDLRLFSEASTTDNNPLFNLGTASTGATGQLDYYFRQTGWGTVDHLKSEGEPLDGTWHHLAFVQQADGTRALYIDGKKDALELPAKADGTWRINTTTVGGILRANPTHWVTGLIDEVVLWSRALSEAELGQVVKEGLDSVFPPLTKGMAAYWPLDEVLGSKTPDLVSGYDLELANLTAADLVTGKVGKAFKFDNARQTMLRRISSPGEQLPINQHPAFTISLWANVTGTGQSDLRLFSEASTASNDPLFNLGTDSGGASGKLDYYFRQSGWTTVNHLKSEAEPLDGTWHHLAFVQQADGTRALYIDGTKDALEIPAKEAGAWRINTTTVGGILRANPTHWVTGLIDDVALWSRALSEAEIKTVVTTGTPVPFSKPQPLAIRSFKSDLPATAAGDKVILRWDVTKNVQVEIDQGIGDVTAKTVSGLGSTEVTLTSSKTFNLTLKRGTETISQTTTVVAISDVAAGWTLIDNFDRYNVGLLNGQGGWADLDAAEFSVVESGGNKFAAPNTGGSTAVLQLGTLTVAEGQERTLFFRAYLVGDESEPVRGQVALTDRPVRFGGDSGADIGPGAVISDEPGTGRQVGGYNGWQNPVELFDPALQPRTAYNIWVDIKNGPFNKDNSTTPPTNLDTGDTYSVHVAKDGTAQRTTIISNYAASRNPVGAADVGFTTPMLSRLILGGLGGHSTSTNLFFDDIYLSKSGYTTTVPRAFGFTVPVAAAPSALSIKAVAGGEIEITFGGGTLESTTSLPGGWTAVPNATASPYKTKPDTVARFYRVRQ